MVEFTGERVVPDQVNADLWSEHFARYAFARRFALDKHVLDCGCGTGYGSAELAQAAAQVTAIDVSPDAIGYARLNYARPNTRYVIGSCLDLPFPSGSFDLVVAFEVIEHLSGFRRFLDECARVLTASGLLLVSTPNKSYYAESRSESGPNPFHEHEFEAGEFRAELGRLFPHISLLTQNRVECFAFTADSALPAEARIEADSGPIAESHFFIALCSKSALAEISSFVYVPTAANLLREREHHIRLLQDHLRRTQAWLAETQQERDDQIVAYDKQKEELEARNRWAESLNERILELQHELAAEQQASAEMAAGYQAKVAELEAENASKTGWALETDQRLRATIGELVECNRLLSAAERTVVERTHWAEQLESEKQALEGRLNAVRASRWVRLGNKVGLGPDLQ